MTMTSPDTATLTPRARAVLDDLMAQGPPVRQLLVEFHHGEAGIGFDATQRAIASLRRAGYRIMDVSRRGLEFSFLHRRD